jgi:hypothetical protein
MKPLVFRFRKERTGNSRSTSSSTPSGPSLNLSSSKWNLTSQINTAPQRSNCQNDRLNNFCLMESLFVTAERSPVSLHSFLCYSSVRVFYDCARVIHEAVSAASGMPCCLSCSASKQMPLKVNFFTAWACGKLSTTIRETP